MIEHYYSTNPIVDHDERMIHYNINEHDYVFKTDAGVFSKNKVDFGTSLLIHTFSVPISGKILDLGCGYGSVGIIIASMLQNGEVVLSDINHRAVTLATYNINLNKQLIKEEIRIAAIQSNGFENLKHQTFDYILLNPPIRAGKSVIYNMFEKAYDYLNIDGELWIVIQKKQGAPSAIKKLKTVFFSVEEVERSNGYYIIKSKK